MDGSGDTDAAEAANLALLLTHSSPPPPELGDPLLPGPLARGITLGTGTIRGAVHTARSVGRVPFHVARYSTAASIELGRQAFEAVLDRTGRRLYAQYAAPKSGGSGQDDHGEAERARVASVVASTFDAAHRGFHYLQLFAAAGFELTGSGVATLLDLSDVLLLLVDSTLGSTESSRALRSIVAFLSREFQNPATGRPGERVGVRDLLWGLCGLVYLQSACRRLDDAVRSRQAIETVVWDVVVLDGRRVDVHENSLYGTHRGAYHSRGSGSTGSSSTATASAGELPETLLRRQIVDALAASDARVVTVSTATTKTITVDIASAQPLPPITPPPGVELVELGPVRPASAGDAQPTTTTYRIVFRINATTPTLPPPPPLPATPKTPFLVEQVDSTAQTGTAMDAAGTSRIEPPKRSSSLPPPPPPPPPLSQPQQPKSKNQAPPHAALANQKKVRLPPGRAPAADNPKAQTQAAVIVHNSAPAAGRRRPPPPPAPPLVAVSDKKGPEGDRKGSSTGFRAVLKRPGLGNLLHRDVAVSQAQQQQQQLGKAAGDASAAAPAPQVRKSSALSASSAAPPPPPKKARQGPSAQPPARGGDRGGRDAASPTPPPLPPQTAQTQMVLTPLTSRALYHHAGPSTAPRGLGGGDAAAHAKRRSMTADDLESLASLASLASSFADNLSVHAATDHHLARGGPPDDAAAAAADARRGSPSQRHRSRANRGSIYTLHTNDSQASLVPASAFRRGAGGGIGGVGGVSGAGSGGGPSGGSTEALDEVRRTGRVPGLFPAAPLLANLQRYMRFSSAAYGRDFLRALGIGGGSGGSGGSGSNNTDASTAQQRAYQHHREIASYAQHTGVAPEDIVLASFIDVRGGPDASGATRMPLVHYVALDHAAHAVVLACRGTLGFEDILADMACEYDALYWRGRTYQVHKGVHASARRLLYGGDGRVLATLRDALLRFPDYGLVLCGHSLGGAVTALLGVMLSEPRPAAAATADAFSAVGAYAFQTAALPPRRLLSDGGSTTTTTTTTTAGAGAGREVPSLPPGRPVHVYAYGPPGTMSPRLCRATRGLITSVVQGDDLVPYLSLGVLHDFQSVALAFKTDDSKASAELWGRLWETFRRILVQKWSGGGSPEADTTTAGGDDSKTAADDEWAYASLKALRASMMSQKLLPPGEVLVVETQRVLQRMTYGTGARAGAGDNTTSRRGSPAGVYDNGGDTLLMVSPARRVVLKYVRDVEARFCEIRFGLAAFADHSPGRYEKTLDQLVTGVKL